MIRRCISGDSWCDVFARAKEGLSPLLCIWKHSDKLPIRGGRVDSRKLDKFELANWPSINNRCFIVVARRSQPITTHYFNTVARVTWVNARGPCALPLQCNILLSNGRNFVNYHCAIFIGDSADRSRHSSPQSTVGCELKMIRFPKLGIGLLLIFALSCTALRVRNKNLQPRNCRVICLYFVAQPLWPWWRLPNRPILPA